MLPIRIYPLRDGFRILIGYKSFAFSPVYKKFWEHQQGPSAGQITLQVLRDAIPL